MFDQLFTSPRAIDHHSTRPLLEERLRYLAHCAAEGSTRSSLRLIASHLLVFIEQFDLEATRDVSLDQIQNAADAWVGSSAHAHNMTDRWHGRMRFISDAKQWLNFLGRLRLPEAPPRPYAHLIEEFCNHLIRDRGLDQSTVRIHRWHIGQFLERFGQQSRPFSAICIRDIDAAIARKGEQDHYTRGSIAHYVGTLRVFFRYAEQLLRLAVQSGEIKAEHPLPDGPSIFNSNDLQTEKAIAVAARARVRHHGSAIRKEKQRILDLSMT